MSEITGPAQPCFVGATGKKYPYGGGIELELSGSVSETVERFLNTVGYDPNRQIVVWRMRPEHHPERPSIYLRFCLVPKEEVA
jgi:hypothetical protein